MNTPIIKPKNVVWLQKRIDTLFEVDKEGQIHEEQLKRALYLLGVYLYREATGEGKPASFDHPSVHAESMKFCQETQCLVPESELLNTACATA